MWQTSRDMLICLVVRSRLKPSVYQRGVGGGVSGWRDVLLCHDSSHWHTCVSVFWGEWGAGGWLWRADRLRQRRPRLHDNRPLIGCTVALLTNHAVP